MGESLDPWSQTWARTLFIIYSLTGSVSSVPHNVCIFSFPQCIIIKSMPIEVLGEL